MMKYSNDVEAADAMAARFNDLRTEVGKVIIGQKDVVEAVFTAIFSNGHCLLVGVPGLAKTLLVQTISQVLDLSYNRIQFTPDLMPGDITGSEILYQDRTFRFIRGPLFANIILADEINRTPPKTQAALLEAMQERCVTVNGVQHKLEEPFFVLATQNPIEQEGTYPLPEAQLDRFMFNVNLTYPAFEDEVNVVKNTTIDKKIELKKVLSITDIKEFQQLVRKVPVSDNVVEYAVKIVNRTRPGSNLATEITNKYLSYGAGPRAGQFLILGAKCHALFNGKYSPDIEDVQAVVNDVLRHRLIRNYKAEAEGMGVEKIISSLL